MSEDQQQLHQTLWNYLFSILYKLLFVLNFILFYKKYLNYKKLLKFLHPIYIDKGCI